MNYGNDQTYFYIKRRPFCITPEDIFNNINVDKWIKIDKENPPKGRLDKACRCDRKKEIPFRVFNKFLNFVIRDMIEKRAQFKFPVKNDTRLYFETQNKEYILSRIKTSKAMEGLDFIKSNFRYYKPLMAYQSTKRRYYKTVVITDSKLRKKFIENQNNKVNYASSITELTYVDFIPELKKEFPNLAIKSIDYFLRLGLTRMDGALRRGCGFLSLAGFHILSNEDFINHYNTLVSLRKYEVIPKTSEYWYIGSEYPLLETNKLKTGKVHHYNSLEAIKALRMTDCEIFRIPKEENETRKIYKYRIINEEIEPELIWKWSADRPKPPKHA